MDTTFQYYFNSPPFCVHYFILAPDTIEFIKVPEKNETLRVQVAELRQYDTFKEMYEDIPLKYFDCEGWTLESMIDGTYEIYIPELEKQWGTLAITMNYSEIILWNKFH